MRTITRQEVEQTLAKRINEAEAELEALKGVTINTNHKTLTNKAVDGGRIGDYIGIGKALYINYFADRNYKTTDITAYSYTDENGNEIGSEGGLRISRTITPLELRKLLDSVIEERAKSLKALKLDLVNASKIVTKHNKLAEQLEALENSVTWATRSVFSGRA